MLNHLGSFATCKYPRAIVFIKNKQSARSKLFQNPKLMVGEALWLIDHLHIQLRLTSQTSSCRLRTY